MTTCTDDRQLMRLAARLALRGVGCVEPNPPVGCVIVAGEADAKCAGQVVGMGHHRSFGGPHAELEALDHAGDRARGATVYVTLEPCNHAGKTPPCVEALIRAGVKRVVIGRSDPHPQAGGGAETLRRAGIAVDLLEGCPEALRLSAAFVTRIRQQRAWFIAKWAQTIDGRIATRTGESKWISGDRARRSVHLLRGRVDAVLTGIGTVKADDPLLTARNVPIRRVARRVIIDAYLETPLKSKLVQTAGEQPTIIFTTEATARGRERMVRQLEEKRVEVRTAVAMGSRLDLLDVARQLSRELDVTRVLVESGPGLLGSLAEAELLDEARVFIAPLLMADAQAMSAVHGLQTQRISDCLKFDLLDTRRYGNDVMLHYFSRVAANSGSA